MIDVETMRLSQEIENIILTIVDEAEDMDRSDLQGRAGAEAMNIIRLIKSQLCQEK